VFRRRAWSTACKRAGLVAVPRPYDLRHSFALLLLAEGRTVHYVAAQLGHSPTLTLSTYGHLIAEYADAGPINAEQEIAKARTGGNLMAGGDHTLDVVVCGSGALVVGSVALDESKRRTHNQTTEREQVVPDPLARRLDAAPLDDEPLTADDLEAMREAREDFAAGRVVSLEELRRELEET
jgi:hypothetical protein